jgi:hypothetical protein
MARVKNPPVDHLVSSDEALALGSDAHAYWLTRLAGAISVWSPEDAIRRANLKPDTGKCVRSRELKDALACV